MKYYNVRQILFHFKNLITIKINFLQHFKLNFNNNFAINLIIKIKYIFNLINTV